MTRNALRSPNDCSRGWVVAGARRRASLAACTAVLFSVATTAAVAGAPVVEKCTSFRIKGQCERDEAGGSVERRLELGGEKKIVTKITVPQQLAVEAQCTARVSISYLQRNDRFVVDATVENDDCVASAGEYKIRAKTSDDAGDIRTREFVETWTRAAPGTIEQRHTYDMQGHSRLVWARVGTTTKSGCKCLAAESAADTP